MINKYSKNIKEQFDAKINRVAPDKCGIICTKVGDCVGFSTDTDNNLCYLSKTPILGQPTDSPFSADYSKTAERCNKVAPMLDTEIASSLDFKKNATYVCTPDEVTNNQSLKIYDNIKKNIGSMIDLPYINVDEYSFENVEWGKEISLNENPDLIKNPQADTNVTMMVEYDDEHLGQYMYHHKCSANISQRDCLKNCLDNQTCVGTEWNHLFVKKSNYDNIINDDNDDVLLKPELDIAYELYRDVCCPKVQIKKVIPRREKFKYGHFYLKEIIDKEDKKFNEKVIVNL